MKGFLQVFYVLFSAIITALAIPNEILEFGSPFLGLFALVPFYTVLTRASSFKEAGCLTALYMSCVHMLTSFWLGYFKDFAVFTLGATTVVYAAAGYWCGGLFFAPFFITRARTLEENAGTKPGSSIRIFLFAVLWTLYEWKKSTGFLAYPWGTLIMSAWKWKIITQIVDISGTWGISFLFALFNAVIGEGLFLLNKTPRRFNIRADSAEYAHAGTFEYARAAAFCCLLFAVSGMYGVYQYTKERTPVKTVRSLLVQPVFDSWLEDEDFDAAALSIELTKKTLEATDKKPDVIVWPESILTYALPGSYSYYLHNPEKEPLVPFIQKTGIPFIIGGPVEVTQYTPGTTTGENAYSVPVIREFNNSALHFGSNGKWLDFYGKVQLVPFAEIIPYADKVWMQKLMQTLAGFSNSWTPGKYYTVFDIPLDGTSVKTGTPICFEDAFPYVCRNLFSEGSEVFFNITNDAWSRTDSAEIQHYVIASYRAQELRTTLVRCTNAGYTCVTDPAGRILYDMPLFESTAAVFDIPIYERTPTLYARSGDWLPLLFCFIWGGFYVLFVLNRRTA